MSENGKTAPQSPRTVVIRKQDKLNRLAKERFRIVNGKVEKYKAAAPVRDVEATVAAAAAAEARARRDNLRPGDTIEDGSIFVGAWAPRDNEGKSLGRIFNVYAAPEDLSDGRGMSYADTVDFVAALENWHGHDGTNYFTEKDLKAALKDGNYKGGWFIPPRELVTGMDAEGSRIQADNLLAHKDKGALRGAFTKPRLVEKERSIWYWSSTKHPVHHGHMHNARFIDGSEGWDSVNGFKLRCRPVRLEPKP